MYEINEVINHSKKSPFDLTNLMTKHVHITACGQWKRTLNHTHFIRSPYERELSEQKLEQRNTSYIFTLANVNLRTK